MTLMTRNLLIGGAVLAGMTAGAVLRSANRKRKHTEQSLDKALDNTFPASDPTASRDFSIPVNRQ